MPDTYQVNEIFTSIQGEGIHAGVPATFIRLQGCTVGCSWCDTKYTWAKGGSRMTIPEIMVKVDMPHVVITGGEPTMYNLDTLMNALRFEDDHFVQMETSGQNALKGKQVPDWVTWSPKPNLGFQCDPALLPFVKEVKFVVDDQFEFDIARKVFWQCRARMTDMPTFVFMPEGCPPSEQQCRHAMQIAMMYPQAKWRYGDRLQYRIGVK